MISIVPPKFTAIVFYMTQCHKYMLGSKHSKRQTEKTRIGSGPCVIGSEVIHSPAVTFDLRHCSPEQHSHTLWLWAWLSCLFPWSFFLWLCKLCWVLVFKPSHLSSLLSRWAARGIAAPRKRPSTPPSPTCACWPPPGSTSPSTSCTTAKGSVGRRRWQEWWGSGCPSSRGGRDGRNDP